MVRTDLRYTYLAKGRYWRFRHPLTGDTKLPGQPGDAAFHARYAELCAAVEQRQKKAEPAKTTWHWLIIAYQRSAEFRALSDDTQRDYLRTLGILQEELGDWNYRLTTTAMIKAVRDSHADKARKAHKIKQMASALYSWAAGEGHVREGFNPAAPIKQIKRKGGAREYIVWSQYEFEAFLKDGSRPMRLAALLALYTGQRAKDIAAMTWGCAGRRTADSCPAGKDRRTAGYRLPLPAPAPSQCAATQDGRHVDRGTAASERGGQAVQCECAIVRHRASGERQ